MVYTAFFYCCYHFMVVPVEIICWILTEVNIKRFFVAIVVFNVFVVVLVVIAVVYWCCGWLQVNVSLITSKKIDVSHVRLYR